MIGVTYKITIHEENEIFELNNQINDNEGAIDRCYQCILSPMFFQTKRKGLWKRLWRLRVKEQQQSSSNNNKQLENAVQGGEGSSFAMCCTNSTSTNSINQYDADEYKLFLNLVNPLKDQQLETLHQAIQSERNCVVASTVGTTGCVLVQRGQKDLMDIEPHVIACRIWKYPDLQYAEELKAIPSCINQKDRVYACCNPTHWSRLCRPGNYYLDSNLIIEIEGMTSRLIHSETF